MYEAQQETSRNRYGWLVMRVLGGDLRVLSRAADERYMRL
jgi:hypothetical protein